MIPLDRTDSYYEATGPRAEPSQILEEHEEMQGVSRGWEKIEAFVEGPRGFIFGVYDQGANAGNVSGLQCPEHRVF